MKRLLAALLLLAPTLAFAAGLSGDGFGSSGFFQSYTPLPPSTGMITPVMASYLPVTFGAAAQFAPAVGSSVVATLATIFNARRIPIPISGTLSGAFGNLNTSQPGATIVDNLGLGTDGSVLCTFTTTTCNSGAHSDHVNAGTLFEWHLNPNGTWVQTSPPPIQISWLFQADSGQVGFILSGPGSSGAVGSSASLFQGFGTSYITALIGSDALASSIIPVAGTITGLYVTPNATENTVPHVYTLFHNGVASPLKCTATPSSTVGCCVNPSGTGTISGTLAGSAACTTATPITIAANDTISLNIGCATVNCANVSPGASIIWNPTTAGQAVVTAQSNTAFGVPIFVGLNDNIAQGSQTTWQVAPLLAATMTLSNLVYCTSTNPGGATARTATLQFATTPIAPTTNSPVTTMFNFASGACPSAASGLAGGSQDTTHSQTVNSGYGLDIAGTVTGSPAGASFKLGMAVTVP